MRFWDTSALVPLLIEQPASETMVGLKRGDQDVIVWWGTVVECTSALARLNRERTHSLLDIEQAFERLHDLALEWNEIDPSDNLRGHARRLLRTHPLRAADALQLAAAFEATEHQPETLAFVTLDKRLRAAAKAEGFRLPKMPDAS